MAVTYSYERAKKSFDAMFKKAALEGKVTIRKDNELDQLTLLSGQNSPLDVERVNMKISSDEIVQFIHEVRKF